MIKLIATDMDGTLLDENGKLPKDFFEILEELKKRKIRFVVASGRPYFTLYENFKPISDELYFICDNGSYIAEKTEEPKISAIDKEYIKEVVEVCDSMENIELILCGTKGAYLRKCDRAFTDEIYKYYIKREIVNDLNNIDDDIFKITICDLEVSKEHSFKVLDKYFKDKLNVVVSGKHWVDISNKDVNKGTALEKIQIDEDISYEETMVFGDFYNDISMLKKAHYSFVMENANEDMKQYGNYIAESNTNNGVIKAIKKYVLNN